MGKVLDVDVISDFPAWSRLLPAVEEICRRAATAAFDAVVTAREPAEMSIVLTDDAAIRTLNRVYRGRDEATNVLSFVADDGVPVGSAGRPGPPSLLGDVVLAYETMANEAARDGKTLADHLSHLVVHGTLHLVGFDHNCDDAAKTMERLEVAVLAMLGIADPYALPRVIDDESGADR
jgi:probable rRNA maturation factor